jgi:hypothetical protein
MICLNRDNIATPLEILNLYYSAGDTSGSKRDKLWHQMNMLLSWENILDNNYQQELRPLLFHILTKILRNRNGQGLADRSPEKTIPRFILDQLKNAYVINLKRNMILLGELQCLMHEFINNDIKCITLKGAYLAENVYENFACRPMADIDLLVRENDIERCHHILINRGFNRLPEESQVNALHDNYLKEGLHEEISVELHRRLTNALYGARFDMQAIWEQTYLPLDYNFVYLSWHAVRHGFLKLIWLCDCAAIIKKYHDSLNWEEIVCKSILYNARKQVQLCLHLISTLLIPDISNSTQLPFKPSFASRISERILFNVQNTLARHRDPDIFTKLLTIHTMERKTLSRFALAYIKR